MLKIKCRWGTALRIYIHSHSPNSITLFRRQEDQKWPCLHENGNKYRWLQPLHLTRAKPLWGIRNQACSCTASSIFEVEAWVPCLENGPLQLKHETRSGPGITVNDLFDILTQKPILFEKMTIVNKLKCFKTVLNPMII